MSNPVAIVFADSHIDDRAWKDRPIEGDSYFALQQIVDAAVKHHIPLVGAGDLLDKRVNKSNPVVEFYRQLDRLQKAGLTLFFIQGQHEYSGVPWLAGHPAAKYVNNTQFDLGSFTAYGMDYIAPPLLQIGLAAIPKGTDVGFFHQVWRSWMGDRNPDGDFSEIGSVRTGFSGDLHQLKRTVTRGRDGQELTMYSPGSTCAQDIAEPHAKHYLVLYDDNSVKVAKLRSRPVIDIGVLASESDLDTFTTIIGTKLQAARDTASDMPEAIRKPLLRVTYPHWLNAQARIMKAVGDLGHVFTKELPPERVVPEDGETVLVARGEAVTMDGLLPDFMAAQQIDYLTEDASRLLNAPDVDAEIRKMREELNHVD